MKAEDRIETVLKRATCNNPDHNKHVWVGKDYSLADLRDDLTERYCFGWTDPRLAIEGGGSNLALPEEMTDEDWAILDQDD